MRRFRFADASTASTGDPCAAEQSPSVVFWATVALWLSVGFGIAGQLLMKWAALRTVGAAVDWSLLPSIVLAFTIYGLGTLSWIVALRHLRLSIAYPLTSLNYAGILGGSYYWFGEPISLPRAVGVALIFLGVLLISVEYRPFGRAARTRELSR